MREDDDDSYENLIGFTEEPLTNIESNEFVDS
jgi:hypothetical protein